MCWCLALCAGINVSLVCCIFVCTHLLCRWRLALTLRAAASRYQPMTLQSLKNFSYASISSLQSLWDSTLIAVNSSFYYSLGCYCSIAVLAAPMLHWSCSRLELSSILKLHLFAMCLSKDFVAYSSFSPKLIDRCDSSVTHLALFCPKPSLLSHFANDANLNWSYPRSSQGAGLGPAVLAPYTL